MTKNTYKTITPADIKESLARLKVQVITKYNDRFEQATKELQEVTKEREESRNVMHDIGLKNKIDILNAERHSLDWCIRTLKETK
jgi:hypothetical protein